MKLHRIKQKIRGWLPPQPTNSSSKLRHYSVPIAIGIAIAISISLFVVAETFLISPAAIKPIPINPEPENSTNPTTEPTQTASPSPTATPMPTSTSTTKEQAITIAMPIIQQYANEHDRTIKSINATLGYCTEDCWIVQAHFEWSGIPSSIPIYDENGTITGYKFPDNADLWIFGYDVAVGIRNGTIHDIGVQGVM
jgi:hypothetical protein